MGYIIESQMLRIGVDYLKYDNCGRTKPVWQPRYDRMRDALMKYWEQPILYALCEWGEDDVWKWGNETGHSWRISKDIFPYPQAFTKC
jgi:alpha-galactosidase